MQIPFTKMHGLGNDLMVLDLVSNKIELSREQIRLLADRHCGVGFDQLLQIEPASDDNVDFNYRIFNADGEEVEHCGNGARCFAKYVHDNGLSSKNPVVVKTVNRILTLLLQDNGDVTVDMSEPEFDPAQIPFAADTAAMTYYGDLIVNGAEQEIEFCALSMGNPHAVTIVDDVSLAAVEDIGEVLGTHPDFPQGCNVGFMQIIDRQNINLRVYERGAGETLACGTGACAAVVAGCLQGLLDDTVTVNLHGGQLTINWSGQGSSVLMTGPATTVYQGTIQI
ncbi:MAG: diaminopimelate epimerase [SAR86 cluster bacterium]|uniref:Diaminopimelate epimerase n=1 Tax=SAR86 cluster bacterium TaxID=2030880 RepID=A0A2A5B9W1_9GAMM|nr:MAG: diaminopimelate epimerase [SAR86 cluster bacterium]